VLPKPAPSPGLPSGGPQPAARRAPARLRPFFFFAYLLVFGHGSRPAPQQTRPAPVRSPCPGAAPHPASSVCGALTSAGPRTCAGLLSRQRAAPPSSGLSTGVFEEGRMRWGCVSVSEAVKGAPPICFSSWRASRNRGAEKTRC